MIKELSAIDIIETAKEAGFHSMFSDGGIIAINGRGESMDVTKRLVKFANLLIEKQDIPEQLKTELKDAKEALDLIANITDRLRVKS